MDPFGNEDIAWLHSQLSGHAHALSGIYERISMAIRRLEDEKSALQKRVKELEGDNHPTTEAGRLRDENATLRSILATTAKEKSEVTRERDVLLRKLDSVKQLVLDPTFYDKATSDTPNADPGPSTAPNSAVRLSHDPRTTFTQRIVSAPEGSSYARTDISEPVTDVTVMLDTPGRTMRARPRTAPTRGASGSQILSSATLGETFIDTRLSVSQQDADVISSPLGRPNSTVNMFALNTSPGMSEGLSVQYEDVSGSNLSGAGSSKTVTVKKWKLHFAKPPSTAEAIAVKAVPTAILVDRLELDEETRRSIQDLSLLPAGSFRLYIHEAFGLAFLYDPVLLESPEATFVVEWSEATGARTTKTYITEAREKHTEMHTFMYTPRKNGWQYIGQQRWSLVDMKPIWHSLIVPAQRALAGRRAQDADIAEITRGLKKGQLEQITVELVQVSILGPNAAEAAVMKKLYE